MPTDPASALQWAIDHARSAGWLFWLLAAAVGWSIRRQQKSLVRTVGARPLPQRPAVAPVPIAAAGVVSAPPPAPPPTPVSIAPSVVADPASMPIRVAVPATTLPADQPPARPLASFVFRDAFGDPSHARTAVILSELLAPPVALR